MEDVSDWETQVSKHSQTNESSGSGVLYFSVLKTEQSLRHARQVLQQKMSQKQQGEVSPLEALTLEVYSTPRSFCHLFVTEIRDGMTRGGSCLDPERDNP